jgi:hypothetical protein
MKPVKKRILHADGYKYLGFCRSKLEALEQLRDDGDVLKKSFHLPDDLIATVICGDVDMITIMKTPFYGFLFHPRAGEMKSRTIGSPPLVQQYYYVDGTGWDPKGEVLPGAATLYPLFDDDHGTRNIRRLNGKTGRWKYRRNPPENYGNIDWKGKNTAKSGQISNAPILTWQGSSSRYFPNQGTFRKLSPNVYSAGRVIAKLPLAVDWHEDGTHTDKTTPEGAIVPTMVLGAAITSDADGRDWLVVMAREYATYGLWGTAEYSQPCFFVKPLKSTDDARYHVDDHPLGWIELHGVHDVASNVSYFFNQSGNQAVAISNFREYSIELDINAKTVRRTIGESTINGKKTTSGGNVRDNSSRADYFEYNLHNITDIYDYSSAREDVTATVAADYIGDRKVYATIAYAMDVESGTYYHNDNWHWIERVTHAVLGYDGGVDWGAQYGNNMAYTNISARTILQMPESEHDVFVYDRKFSNKNNESWSESTYSYLAQYGSHDACPWTVVGEDSLTKSDHRAVLFLDLRHDIVVTGGIAVESSYSTGDYMFYSAPGYKGEVMSTTYWTHNDRTASDRTQIDTLYINGEKVGDGFNQYLGIAAGEWSLAPYHLLEYPNGWIGGDSESPCSRHYFMAANHPLGSWAVDRQGNHFYSMLVKDGVYNYLTGGEPVTLTETAGDNPVFFPIAPI